MDYRQEIRRIVGNSDTPVSLKDIVQEIRAIVTATVERMAAEGDLTKAGWDPTGHVLYITSEQRAFRIRGYVSDGQKAILGILQKGPADASVITEATGADPSVLNGDLQKLRLEGYIVYDRRTAEWSIREEP